MSDEQSHDQHEDVSTAGTDGDSTKSSIGGKPPRQATRRPRPAPVSPARRRAQIEQPSGLRMLIVPLFAVVALLALILAVVIDHVHSSSNTAAAPTITATVAPSPTAAPTNTPIPIPPPVTTKPGVAAEVNGEIVPMDLFTTIVHVDANRMQLGGTDQTTGQPIPPVDLSKPAGLKQFHQQEQNDLNQLIQTAGAVAYARKHNLVATTKQVQAALNSIYTQGGGKAAFLKGVKGEGYTEAAVTKIVTDEATVQNVYAQIGKQAPYDGKIVRHILIATKNKALADTLAKELQANHGSNFAALAKKNSTDTQTAAQGGDLGVVVKGQLDAAVDKVVFSLKKGDISNPVKSQAGWDIVQVQGPGQSQTSKGNYFTAWLKQQQAKAITYVKIPKS